MRRKLLALYSRLDSKLKTRNWKCEWPAETRYEIAVGAVLAQNTDWRNAEKAISNLKEAGLLSEKAILETPNPELETLIRPSGFYRQKAPRLKFMTETWLKLKEIAARPGTRSPRSAERSCCQPRWRISVSRRNLRTLQRLRNGKRLTLEMRELLLETHGIGRETADSILLYALNKPIFVVDAYTRRFCKTFLGREWKDYEDCRRFSSAGCRGTCNGTRSTTH